MIIRILIITTTTIITWTHCSLPAVCVSLSDTSECTLYITAVIRDDVWMPRCLSFQEIQHEWFSPLPKGCDGLVSAESTGNRLSGSQALGRWWAWPLMERCTGCHGVVAPFTGINHVTSGWESQSLGYTASHLRLDQGWADINLNGVVVGIRFWTRAINKCHICVWVDMCCVLFVTWISVRVSMHEKNRDSALLFRVQGPVSGLALDWIHHLLYWSSTGSGSVHVGLLDGSAQRALVAGLEKPSAVAVDPLHRWVVAVPVTVEGQGWRWGRFWWGSPFTSYPVVSQASLLGSVWQLPNDWASWFGWSGQEGSGHTLDTTPRRSFSGYVRKSGSPAGSCLSGCQMCESRKQGKVAKGGSWPTLLSSVVGQVFMSLLLSRYAPAVALLDGPGNQNHLQGQFWGPSS